MAAMTPDSAGAPTGRQPGLETLSTTAALLRVAAGLFLAFEDSNAAAAADIEEAMELSAERRAEKIARLEKELREALDYLAELNEDLPANETTAKAIPNSASR